MKILAIRPTLEDEQFLQRLCRRKHWDLMVTHRFGRPREDYPVQKVLDALRKGLGVRAAAEMHGLSPGTVKRIKDGEIKPCQ